MLAINERSDLLKECGHKYKELLMDIWLYDKPLEAPVDPPELGEDTHITQVQSDTSNNEILDTLVGSEPVGEAQNEAANSRATMRQALINQLLSDNMSQQAGRLTRSQTRNKVDVMLAEYDPG